MVMGSLCPHVHCHLLPRSFADDPTKPVNMNEQQVFLVPDEYAARLTSCAARSQPMPPPDSRLRDRRPDVTTWRPSFTAACYRAGGTRSRM